MKKLIPIIITTVVLISAAVSVICFKDDLFPQQTTNSGFELISEAELPASTPAVKPSPEPTPASTPLPTSEPIPEKGTFGEKWGSIFSKKGQNHLGSNYYQNENVYITTRVHHESKLTYTVADIYIRDITNLKTGFAHEKYRGRSEDFLIQSERTSGILAITGDFYSHEKRGLVIRNGEVYRDVLSDWDICVLYKDGTMKTYSPSEAKENLDKILASEPWQSWCFGPILLKDGKAITERNDFNTSVFPKNPRNAIGYYEPGHYCFVSVDGRQGEYSAGLTIGELSALMEELGCAEAYNLDGGQTAAMLWQGEIYNKPSGGGRAIPDIIYIDSEGDLD